MSSAHIPIIKNAEEIPLPIKDRRHFPAYDSSKMLGWGPYFGWRSWQSTETG